MMATLRWIGLVTCIWQLAFCSATAPAAGDFGQTALPVGDDYKLVWSDEFQGQALDRAKWDYRQLGPRRDAVNVEDTVTLDGQGHLVLTTRRSGDVYETAMIGTQGTFETTFGYFECRVKLQSQVGHWSAFWLQSPSLGNPLGDAAKAGTEIDIFEYLRKDGDLIRHNLHWDGYGADHKHAGQNATVPGLGAGWHTVGLLWTEAEYVFYVDGRETWRTGQAVSRRDQYMILSLEVGPWAGDIAQAELPDTLLVDYVRVYQRAAEPGTVPLSDANIHLRGAFENARVRFERDKKGHVAFIGGSITEMNGYRPMVMEMLERRFPETAFTFTSAGISSTCSTTGAFRLTRDVLSQGPVDLFFVEFAVNDDQDAHHARRECIRGMEGIVRHTRRHNASADIVMVYFVNPEMLATWQAGQVPVPVSAHDAVAEQYHIPTINLARETAEQITAGTLTWERYGGVHPGPIGNRLCTNMIDRLMAMAWSSSAAPQADLVAHSLPELLDDHSYFAGRLIGPEVAVIVRDMVVEVPDWASLEGACRERFASEALLCGTTPGAEMTLEFYGTAIGAYVLAGPDAGIVEATIDGQTPIPVNLYHEYSRGLHYPRTVMFDADLAPGRHRLTLRISDEKDERSSGYALRVLNFVNNRPPRPGR